MNISAAKSQSNSKEAQKAETAQNEAAAKKAEESKPAIKNPENTEKKEETKQESEFKKLLENQNQDKMLLEGQNPQNQLNPNNLNQDIASKFGFDVGDISSKKYDLSMNYNSATISKDDAKFFSDLVDNKQFAIQENGGKTNIIKFADEIGPTYKTQQASKILANLIEKAYNDNKPVRIDFDNNVSVIMKIDKSGKITAEFIPGDKAVEEYLRNNIRSLRQSFDDQNLPYNDLLYRQSKNNQNQEKQNHENQQNQRKNKGE